MSGNGSFVGLGSAPQLPADDLESLQDVALACVEGDEPLTFAAWHRVLHNQRHLSVQLNAVFTRATGIVSALASSDTKRAKHIAERLADVLNGSTQSLPPTVECTCHRTMGCAYRRFGDHVKASECFKAALAAPDGEDTFQRVNTLMLLSNSMSSLQR